MRLRFNATMNDLYAFYNLPLLFNGWKQVRRWWHHHSIIHQSTRDCPFFWNLALPNQCLGRNLGPTNPSDGKRHRQSKLTLNAAILQPFSSPLSSLYMTSLKLFNLNRRKRNNWKYKSLRRWNNNLGTSTLGDICGHLTRFSYIPSETLAFICHELHKCTLSAKS